MTVHVKDIEYSPSRLLDLYLADRPRRPLVVCVHGGGFVSGDKDDPRSIQAASILRNAGFNCASITYSLARESDRFGQWPRNLFDVADAVAFLHERAHEYGYDAGRFAMLGNPADVVKAYESNRSQAVPENRNFVV